MTNLQSIIEGVLRRPCKLFVKLTKAVSDIQLDTPKKGEKKTRKVMVRLPQLISTPGGLMKCSPAPFDPTTYKGLKQNCGRALSPAALEVKLKKA